MADTRAILIRNLGIECSIGVHRHEQGRPQRVLVDVELEVEPVPHHDDVRRVVSYEDVVASIRDIASQGHIHLVETLAERIADSCLSREGALGVDVTVLKTDVLPGETALGVQVRKSRR